MEFLVHMDVLLPPGMPPDERQRLLEQEAARGRELIGEGTLVRIWRIPGRQSNWSLYRAADATALHAAVTSLPLWPYMDVRAPAGRRARGGSVGGGRDHGPARVAVDLAASNVVDPSTQTKSLSHRESS